MKPKNPAVSTSHSSNRREAGQAVKTISVSRPPVKAAMPRKGQNISMVASP